MLDPVAEHAQMPAQEPERRDARRVRAALAAIGCLAAEPLDHLVLGERGPESASLLAARQCLQDLRVR